MNELISVIMSTYNENFDQLTIAIESILNQTYSHFEFIIVLDNPNNQEIFDLLKKYKNSDHRIKLIINEKNEGLAFSLNKAIDSASGCYIARMDADDKSMETRLEEQIKYLIDNRLDVVSTNCIYIDENGVQIGTKSQIPILPNELKRILPFGSSIIHPSVLMSKVAFDNVGGYRGFRTAQDYDLWLRMLSYGYNIGSIDKPLIYYRIRSNSISGENRFKQCLTSEYQRKLYKERLGNPYSDSFSYKHYESYLSEHGLYNNEKIEFFLKAYSFFEGAFNCISKKRYLKGFINILKAMLYHSSMRTSIIKLFIYKFFVMFYTFRRKIHQYL